MQERFGELHGNYLASSITLTAFLSLFPLVLVVIAVVGFLSSNSSDLATDIVGNLGLTGDAARLMNDAIATAEESKGAASIVGLVGLLWSGLGLIAAIQFALNSIWQIKDRGIKDKAFGLAWLTGAGLIIAASVGVTALIALLPGWVAPLAVLAGLAVNTALFLWTFKVLTNRSIGPKNYLPGAILGAVGFEVLKAVGGFYVPKIVASSSALYGSIGIVFAILAWLLFFGRLLVYSAVLNVVRWEEDNGTVSVEIEVPKMPGNVPTEATRSGEEQPATSGDAESGDSEPESI